MAATTTSMWSIAVTGAMLMVAPTAAQAVFTLPSGLNPGDHYRLVFVTSGTRDAITGNMDNYVTFVNDQAALAPDLPATTWLPIASTTAIPANGLISCGATCNTYPIFLVTGAKVANSLADLLDGSIITAIHRTQAGTALPAESYVWTGSTALGIPIEFQQLGTATPRAGSATDIDSRWMSTSDGGVFDDEDLLHLYAISGELTVPGAIPEPSTIALFGAGGAALLALRRRRAKTA